MRRFMPVDTATAALGGFRTFLTRGHGVLPSLPAAMAVARRVRGGPTARQVADSKRAGRCCQCAVTTDQVSGFFTLPLGGPRVSRANL